MPYVHALDVDLPRPHMPAMKSAASAAMSLVLVMLTRSQVTRDVPTARRDIMRDVPRLQTSQPP